MSFWVKYRCENFRDFLRVEVSTNGTTWVSLIGQNTVRQPGTSDGARINDSSALTGINEFWSREVFDLKNFLGASALRLRFRFNSGANSIYVYDNDAGFNIDDILVVTGGTPALLPLELTSFTGYNDAAVNILNWKTATEFNTKHFIVQKSVNAVDYEDIGIVAAAGNSYTTKNYTFTDKTPYKGENLYRLKMVDLDNTYKYSKLVSIILQDETAGITPTGIEKIYPNPTNGKMFVNINVNEEQTAFNYRVFNVFGQVVNDNNITLTRGQHTLELDASAYANGQYFITLTDRSKGISYEEKFIKM